MIWEMKHNKFRWACEKIENMKIKFLLSLLAYASYLSEHTREWWWWQSEYERESASKKKNANIRFLHVATYRLKRPSSADYCETLDFCFRSNRTRRWRWFDGVVLSCPSLARCVTLRKHFVFLNHKWWRAHKFSINFQRVCCLLELLNQILRLLTHSIGAVLSSLCCPHSIHFSFFCVSRSHSIYVLANIN